MHGRGRETKNLTRVKPLSLLYTLLNSKRSNEQGYLQNEIKYLQIILLTKDYLKYVGN
jgi:hypothetical protein